MMRTIIVCLLTLFTSHTLLANQYAIAGCFDSTEQQCVAPNQECSANQYYHCKTAYLAGRNYRVGVIRDELGLRSSIDDNMDIIALERDISVDVETYGEVKLNDGQILTGGRVKIGDLTHQIVTLKNTPTLTVINNGGKNTAGLCVGYGNQINDLRLRNQVDDNLARPLLIVCEDSNTLGELAVYNSTFIDGGVQLVLHDAGVWNLRFANNRFDFAYPPEISKLSDGSPVSAALLVRATGESVVHIPEFEKQRIVFRDISQTSGLYGIYLSAKDSILSASGGIKHNDVSFQGNSVGNVHQVGMAFYHLEGSIAMDAITDNTVNFSGSIDNAQSIVRTGIHVVIADGLNAGMQISDNRVTIDANDQSSSSIINRGFAIMKADDSNADRISEIRIDNNSVFFRGEKQAKIQIADGFIVALGRSDFHGNVVTFADSSRATVGEKLLQHGIQWRSDTIDGVQNNAVVFLNTPNVSGRSTLVGLQWMVTDATQENQISEGIPKNNKVSFENDTVATSIHDPFKILLTPRLKHNALFMSMGVINGRQLNG